MEKTNILYGVIGLLLGIVIMGSSCFMNHHRGYSKEMHRMPDGSMMSNSSMNMGMEDMMKSMMSGLEGKTGDAFDKEFLAQMIVHHQGAVEMAKAVLETSQKPELIKLANDIISAQNNEIEMMQQWKKAWFKE